MFFQEWIGTSEKSSLGSLCNFGIALAHNQYKEQYKLLLSDLTVEKVVFADKNSDGDGDESSI
jgi:hypothetical protein